MTTQVEVGRLSIQDVAREMVLQCPEALLRLADWCWWPTQPNSAGCIHIVGNGKWCGAEFEWFNPDRTHKAVITRTVPEGKDVCIWCATEVLRHYRER